MSKKYGEETIVSVAREGKVIVLPKGMEYDDAIRWLRMRRDEEDEEVTLQRNFECFPSEGAIALGKTLKNRYGWTNQKSIPGEWGTLTKPASMSVQVGVREEVSVPWGRFQIPGVTGWVQCGASAREGAPTFTLYAEILRKNQAEVEAMFNEVASWVIAESIYRNHAIELQFPDDDASMEDHFPKFLEVTAQPSVFPVEIEESLSDNVYGPVIHTEAFRKANIPLKMGVLLEGPYGCGKTLTANRLASTCTDNGWTYILVKDSTELARAVKIARRYQPAVVFCEDIDRYMEGEERNAFMDTILNTIDGIESKGTEIMVVLTTNKVEKINTAMLRPGRLDVVIPITPPDAEAVGRMIRLYAGDLIPEGESLAEVGDVLEGNTPAIIREVVERSKRSSIATGGGADKLSAEALLRAANGMARHLALTNRKLPEEVSDIRYAADRVAEAMTEVIDITS